MSFFNYLTLHNKLHIRRDDIVIDIGSGNNPILRANILVDKYIDIDVERYSGIIIDRPFLNADAEKLPFKNKAIDFVYCSHVLEHIPNPDFFLRELERVGKRGIIVTPHGDYEKLDPRKMHLWYIWNNDGKLLLKQKYHWDEYSDFSRYFYQITISQGYWKFYSKNWKLFNTTYLWEEKIDYEIIRDSDFDFSKFMMGFSDDWSNDKTKLKIPAIFQVKSLIGKLVRRIISLSPI